MKLNIALLVFGIIGTSLSSILPNKSPEPKSASHLLDRENYHGFQVYSVLFTDKSQYRLFEELQSKFPLDVWKAPTPTLESKLRNSGKIEYRADFMVAPEDTKLVGQFLKENGLDFSIKMKDVGAVVEEQRVKSEKARELRIAARQAGAKAQLNWDEYFRSDEIYEWLDELVANNSDIASISTLGNSYEGRPLKLVKISKPGSPSNKTAVLLDGGFHAREWISPAIITYLLDQILNNRTANDAVLDEVDIYIIPIVNIDGKEYSHEGARMWRKTRSKNNGSCIGTDPNRNFDFHFGEAGTSGDSCSEIYRGPFPYSEPETAILRDVAMNSSINFKSYLTIHSYGQWWLTPWSWTDDLPEDYQDMMRFGNLGADALTKVHGTPYVVGATTEILGATAGCSDDWAKAVAGIKYANTIEVRDTGRYGFLLPPEQILDTAEETWAGIRQVLLYINRLAS